MLCIPAPPGVPNPSKSIPKNLDSGIGAVLPIPLSAMKTAPQKMDRLRISRSPLFEHSSFDCCASVRFACNPASSKLSGSIRKGRARPGLAVGCSSRRLSTSLLVLPHPLIHVQFHRASYLARCHMHSLPHTPQRLEGREPQLMAINQCVAIATEPFNKRAVRKLYIQALWSSGRFG